MLKTRTNRIVWSTIAVLAVLPLVHVGYVLAQTPNVKVRAKPPMFSKAFVAEFLPEAREKLIALPLSGGEAATGGPAATPNGGAPGATTVATLAPWKELISRETIEDEIKKLVVPLQEEVKAAGRFKKSGYRNAHKLLVKGAMLFAVIDQYDGDVRWKKEAKGIRDMLAHAGRVTKAGTDGSHREAKESAETLETLVRGGSVNVEPKETEEFNWNQMIEFVDVMKLLGEEAKVPGEQPPLEVELKKYTANKADFDTKVDDVLRHAEMTAVLGAILLDKEYGFEGDDKFGGFAKELSEGGKQVAAAARQKNHDAARSAMGMVTGSCTNCHGEYR